MTPLIAQRTRADGGDRQRRIIAGRDSLACGSRCRSDRPRSRRNAVNANFVDAEVPAISAGVSETETDVRLIVRTGETEKFNALGFDRVVVYTRTDIWSEGRPLT
jgi:hypothetical protein